MLHEDLSAFVISQSVLLGQRDMFRTKVVEKIKMHTLHSIIYFENHAVGKYVRAKQATDENVTQRMRFIC